MSIRHLCMPSTSALEKESRRQQKTLGSPRTVLLFGAFLLVYSLVTLLLFRQIGFLTSLEDVIFSTPDSRAYRVYADFLAGEGPMPGPYLLALRPFLFPLYLSLYHHVGLVGFLMMQWFLSLVMLVATFASVTTVTKSRWWGFISALAITAHPTFSFIALHALAETFSLALLSLAVYAAVVFFRRGGARPLFYTTFLLSLATCSKPTYLPFLVLWCLYAACQLISRRYLSMRAAIAAPLSVAPVIAQFVLTSVLIGHTVFSTAGTVNFQSRFFPAVYGFAHGRGFIAYSDPEAKDARRAYPELREAMAFVVTHPYATAQTATYLLHHNLASASSFTRPPKGIVADRHLGNLLAGASALINTAMLAIHIVGAIVSLLLLLSRDPDCHLLAFLALLSYSVFALSILTYWQGDRLVLAALPAWTVLYAMIGWKVVESPHSQRLTRAFKRLCDGLRGRRPSQSA
jgi:hypothetical protein